jgi:hypothetical protein
MLGLNVLLWPLHAAFFVATPPRDADDGTDLRNFTELSLTLDDSVSDNRSSWISPDAPQELFAPQILPGGPPSWAL